MANETVADVMERPREHRENRKKNRGRKVLDNQAQAIAKFVKCLRIAWRGFENLQVCGLRRRVILLQRRRSRCLEQILRRL